MQASGRRALARWAWRGKEYVVEMLTRCAPSKTFELAPVGAAELALALRLIEQISDERYDPRRFVDEEKQRILAAVERKIAGRKVLAQPANASRARR